MDFVGKIKSGRLWQQVEKCTGLSDDVYFILENPYSLKYTKMNLASIYGAMIALSRKCKIITTRSAGETKIVLMRLHERYATDRKVNDGEMRVKLKTKDDDKLAQYCLMGIPSVGSARAKELLADFSIAELCDLSLQDLEFITSKKVAKNIHAVLHAKSQ